MVAKWHNTPMAHLSLILCTNHIIACGGEPSRCAAARFFPNGPKPKSLILENRMIEACRIMSIRGCRRRHVIIFGVGLSITCLYAQRTCMSVAVVDMAKSLDWT